MHVTVNPAVFSKRPQLEAMMPFPTPEITPADDSALEAAYTLVHTGNFRTSSDQDVLHLAGQDPERANSWK